MVEVEPWRGEVRSVVWARWVRVGIGIVQSVSVCGRVGRWLESRLARNEENEVIKYRCHGNAY